VFLKRKQGQRQSAQLLCVVTGSRDMTMKASKQNKLEAKGWKVGSATDFLGLSAEDESYIEMKLALSGLLKRRRQKRRLSQVKLAELIDSSQSRVAKMEAADPSVSIDLLVKSLLAVGVSRKEVAQAISRGLPAT
jgi:predicted XRE-type DNA-binding protein